MAASFVPHDITMKLAQRPTAAVLAAFLVALLAMGVCCTTPAFAAANPAQYLLTQNVLNKLKAAEADLVKAGHKQDSDGGDAKDNPTVEDLVRTIETDRTAKAALANHGLTSREYALASFAILHAGFYVMMEEAMDKKKAAELLATFTKEQRANIALVRTMKK